MTKDLTVGGRAATTAKRSGAGADARCGALRSDDAARVCVAGGDVARVVAARVTLRFEIVPLRAERTRASATGRPSGRRLSCSNARAPLRANQRWRRVGFSVALCWRAFGRCSPLLRGRRPFAVARPMHLGEILSMRCAISRDAPPQKQNLESFEMLRIIPRAPPPRSETPRSVGRRKRHVWLTAVMMSFIQPISLLLPSPPPLPPPRASRSPARVSAPPRRQKPRNYWADRRNLASELHAFAQQHATSSQMPTAAQLLAAGRVDLLRAVQRHGGFAAIASHIGLVAVRRQRSFDFVSYVRLQLLPLFQSRVLTPGVMPSASQLRDIHRADLLPCIAAAGGFSALASELHLLPARLARHQQPVPSVPPLLPLVHPAYPNDATTPPPLTPPPSRCNTKKKKRRHRHYWNSWRNFEAELRAFAKRHCHGYMPLQRHFIEAKRTDLLNALRIHGGVATVARRIGLVPPPASKSKRPRGYWNDPAVLNAQLLTFTARNGYPGLMPTRRQLLNAGRTDIAYAVEKYGGYAKIAAKLHLVWHGPCCYWRVFRNLERRLLTYMRSKRLKRVMPFLKTLYDDGRMDLVYGIARHGGIMKVAKRIGLKVEFPHRKPHYWQHPSHLQLELEDFLRLQPLQARQYMPTSVVIVQAGRADLATAIRDHGGWLYFAQRLGLRFNFEVRPQGFWQRESNVVQELNNYMLQRYGSWEHPGKLPPQPVNSYIPSIDMLKRDGRSDIAFAIDRYHDGISAFALRNGFQVAEDVVPVMAAEEWMMWKRFAPALRSWIAMHGSNGIMPSRDDFIRTGRHDLRFATYSHGGTRTIAQRLQLVSAEEPMDQWLTKWLGIQAAKLGLLLNLVQPQGNYLSSNARKMMLKLERDLGSAVVGQCKRMMTTTAGNIVHGRATSTSIRGTRIRKNRVGMGKNGGWRSGTGLSGRISPEELEKLRTRYRHLPPDDIITV